MVLALKEISISKPLFLRGTTKLENKSVQRSTGTFPETLMDLNFRNSCTGWEAAVCYDFAPVGELQALDCGSVELSSDFG